MARQPSCGGHSRPGEKGRSSVWGMAWGGEAGTRAGWSYVGAQATGRRGTRFHCFIDHASCYQVHTALTIFFVKIFQTGYQIQT